MKFKPSFFFWLVFVFFITNLIHESAHWLMGTALGLDMQFGLNIVRSRSPAEPWQKMLCDVAGPIVTIVQAVIAYLIVQRKASTLAFAFLYTAAFSRAVAGLVSFLHPNDEARVSMYFGLGKWTLPILVAGGLIVLVVKASRRLQLKWKDQLLCYVVASLAVSAIVGLDRFVL
ncbi:hypothetical protein LK542_19155 [Massilia sp. IC2-477]|uniref:hypothetical protein n=1 Tax=Massilia sp. IC2-477 TaxID=2887198 RepID=UPI001D117F7F|nr:hypothetical protein [Massilia sp. IC2-477]MCC2957741.1 hypothetical protein [Massilia sp. IC2-477]